MKCRPAGAASEEGRRPSFFTGKFFLESGSARWLLFGLTI